MWTYTGHGEFFPGVPARDLTDEEFAAAEAAVPGVRDSGLYVEKPARAKAASAPEPAPAQEG